jgi:hypothetical protein
LFVFIPRFLTILAYFWPLFLSTDLFLFSVIVFGRTSALLPANLTSDHPVESFKSDE